MGRNTIEVSLAKPLSDKRKQAQAKREQRKPYDPPFNPRNSAGDAPPSGPPSGNFGGYHNNHSAPRGGGRSDGSYRAYSDSNNFGAFGGDNSMGGGPPSRGGGSSQRGGNRGGGVSDVMMDCSEMRSVCF